MQAGADMHRAGRALLRPARRRAGDPRGRRRARSPRAPTWPACWRWRARSRRSVPVVLMCYANMVLAPGVEAFVERLARDRRVRADRARPAAARRPARCSPPATRAGSRSCRSSLRPRRPSASRRSARRARGFLYTVSVVGHDRGARRARRALRRGRRARARPPPRCRSRSASASPPPSRPRQAADAGADGVIVGTRLVRAAGESADPAGRARRGSCRGWPPVRLARWRAVVANSGRRGGRMRAQWD